jgi:hypothetical protein
MNFTEINTVCPCFLPYSRLLPLLPLYYLLLPLAVANTAGLDGIGREVALASPNLAAYLLVLDLY